MMWRHVFCAALILFLGAGKPAFAQVDTYLEPVEPRRLALVVGYDEYANHVRLPGAKADADLVATRLQELNFEVVRAPARATAFEFWTLDLSPFRERIREGDVVFFYYSGHGFIYGGESFLAPLGVPTKSEPWRVASLFIGEGGIRSMLQQNNPSFVGIIIDACQSQAGFVDTSVGGIEKSLGVAPPLVPASKDYWVAYAAQRGAPAMAGADGAVSPFTKALDSHIAEPDVEILSFQRKVQYSLRDASGGSQEPHFVNSLVTNLWLNPTATIQDHMRRQWVDALETGNRQAIKDYLAFYASGPFASAARRWLLEGGRDVERKIAVSPVSAEIGWLAAGKSAVRVPRYLGDLNISNTADLSQAASIAEVRSELDVNKLAFASIAYSNVSEAADTDPVDFDPTILGRSLEPNGMPLNGHVEVERHEEPTRTVNLGKPLFERSLLPDPDGLGTTVDPRDVSALLAEVGKQGKKISWISIGTQKAWDPRTDVARGLLGIDARQRLVENGISPDIITSTENLPEVIDGVRLRIFVK